MKYGPEDPKQLPSLLIKNFIDHTHDDVLNLAAVHASPGSTPDFLNKLVDVPGLEQALFSGKKRAAVLAQRVKHPGTQLVSSAAPSQAQRKQLLLHA